MPLRRKFSKRRNFKKNGTKKNSRNHVGNCTWFMICYMNHFMTKFY